MSGVSYSLSGADMMKGCNNKAKIILYPDLYNYKNIDELLSPHGAIFLLYEYKPRYGHWTLLFRQNDTIEHFDSYNHKPDDEFSFIPEYFREVNNMMYPRLTRMLHDSNEEIHYNNFKLQKSGGDIATCGRHCLARLKHKDLNINQYYSMLKYISKKMNITYDEIVYYMTREFDSNK